MCVKILQKVLSAYVDIYKQWLLYNGPYRMSYSPSVLYALNVIP